MGDDARHPYCIEAHQGQRNGRCASSGRPTDGDLTKGCHQQEGDSDRVAGASGNGNEEIIIHKQWQDTRAALQLKKRLLDTNQQDLERLLERMERAFVDEVSSLDRLVAELQHRLAQSAKTHEERESTFKQTIEKLLARISSDEQRIQQLEVDLVAERRESGDARDNLLHVAKSAESWKDRWKDSEAKVKRAHKEGTVGTALLADYRSRNLSMTAEVAHLQEECERLLQENAALRVDMHRCEKWSEELNSHIASSDARKATQADRRTADMQAALDQFQRTNHRLLQIIASSEELGPFFAFVGGDVQYVDTSQSPTSSPATRLKMADLRGAVQQYRESVHLGLTKHLIQPAGDPKGLLVPRLASERDYWVPSAALHIATAFHHQYFPDAPPSLFSLLTAELWKAMLEGSGSRDSNRPSHRPQSAALKPASRVAGSGTNEAKGSPLDAFSSDGAVVDAIRAMSGLKVMREHMVSAMCTAAVGTYSSVSECRQALHHAITAIEALLIHVQHLRHESSDAMKVRQDRCVSDMDAYREHIKIACDDGVQTILAACDAAEARWSATANAIAEATSTGGEEAYTKKMHELVEAQREYQQSIVRRIRDAAMGWRAAVRNSA